MAIRYDANTSAIKKKLWPLVNKAMENSNVKRAYKNLVNDFIANRSIQLYDNIPCDRILCSENEMDKLFGVLKIKKSDVTDIIGETYYGNISNFNPLAAKHEFTVTQLLVIRYYYLNKMQKDCELAILHLAFSGKFYPSLHYRSYPTVTPVRHVMEYVVNNRLSKKFDLSVYGNVFGAVKSVALTWLETYKDRFNKLEDEDVVYLIQQLHSRIGSFIKNIAEEYYEVYEDKDNYITYSSDSLDSDDFHLADNNTLKVSKYTEATVNAINSSGVDYKICKMCSNSDITPNECKAVMESIIGNRENIYSIKELISLMISLYFASGEQDLTDIKFITYTISPKPNAKQKEIVRMKEIIENWLCESGTAYMRRRSRTATRNSYERAVRMYFALVIHNNAR
jgi:hypothetical protein